MTTKKIYGPWIKWRGGERPVPIETLVEVKFRDGSRESGRCAHCYSWRRDNDDDDIVEYRTITEQADLDAAEKLLRDNGYTITPPAKPLTFEDVTPMTEAPPEGTVYWVVSSAMFEGVCPIRSSFKVGNQLNIQRRMAYLDKEHALVAARHIFGLKGGEL